MKKSQDVRAVVTKEEKKCIEQERRDEQERRTKRMTR